MKKKFILLAMMLLTIMGGVKFNVLNAQETITIGSGEGTSKYLPSWIFYKYSVSQQFFSATEIGHADGLITQIAIRPKGSANTTRKFEIYIENTEDSMFPNGKTESYLVSTLVFSGDVSFGASGSWTVIELDTPFEYSGKNVLLCINDITGSDLSDGMDFYTYSTGNNTSAYRYNDNSKYEPSTTTYSLLSAYSNYFLKSNNQIQFTFGAPAEPSLEVSETSIALGNVRMDDNFFTEKPFSPKDVEVKVTSTTVTSVTCDNSFFTIELPAEVDYSKTFTFSVGYNKEANVTEPQSGTITISADGVENITIPVSATPYTATAPDAIEAFTTVTFDGNNAYTDTPTFANLHDDYILPGEDEATNGNAPDAVYQFELTEDATISASITGDGINNSYLAIYSEDFGEKDGPSSDNNNPGVQSGQGGGSSAPTTFGPYTFTTDGTDLTNNFNSSGWVHYAYGYDYIYTYTAGSYILTKIPFQITNNSVLSFAAKNVYTSGTEYYNVFISTDDVYGNADDIIVKTGSTTSTTNESIPLENYSGNEYYIGISYTTKYNMVGVDYLALTGGDGGGNQSQAISAIDAVQYPAGTYYLVAAADNAFTVNLSTASVPAPAEFALTAPEDNATGQNNPKLTWETAQYATEYNVYLGTSEDLTNVEPKTVTTNSYQTEGLQNNTKYYWTVEAVNAQGTTATTSETWSFVTTLDVPTITSEKEVKIFTDETATITWEEIDAASGYNVYNGGTKLNEQLIEETSYTLEGLAYNMTGYNITVKAVYDGLGESEASEAVNVKVSGYNLLEVTVTNGTNPIKGATVSINGTDEFGNVIEKTVIDGTTNENGIIIAANIKTGNYTVSASRIDYEDTEVNSVVVAFSAQVQTASVTMSSSPTAPETLLNTVAVTESYGAAEITWKGANNNTQMYNVYRKDVATDVVTLIAENQNSSYNINKTYADDKYSELQDGKYQYGVTTMVEMNEEIELMNEGFGNGSLPAGWTYNNGWYSYSNDGNPPGCAYFWSTSSYVTGQLYTTIIDLTQNTTAKLIFDYKNIIGNQYANDFYVDVYSENGTRLKSQKVTGDNVASYTSYELSLNDYVGQKLQLCFRGYNYSWGYTYIDNVVVSGTKSKTVESAAVWSNVIKKGGIMFTNAAGDNKWETAANWSTGKVPGTEDEVIIKAAATISENVKVAYLAINGGSVTLNNGATLTVTGDLISSDITSLYINDGAQLIQPSENVKATFNMGINKPTNWSNENKDGWQFIASPFDEAPITDFTNNNVYDLYKYNGTADAEWDNHKDNSAEFGYYFVNGTGYLASYKEVETAKLSGTLNNAQSHTWNLAYTTETTQLENFHLIGNPFSFDMDMRKVSYTNMVEGVAVVTSKGGYDYSQTTIPAGDGFFVKATAADATMTYNANSKVSRGEKANSLIITATSNEGNDNVVVNFNGEKEGFNKLQNFNEAIATVYVQNEGKNYGIANFNEDVQEIELCFNANQMGNYTISIEPNGKFQSVTLVDRFTGIETNMLLEDYHFTAMSNVNNNRFIVKLVNGQQTTDNSHFAYVMGEELIIEAEGAVEIIDMMGRVVYSNDAACHVNRINVSAFDNAAYVIRVVNENGVKVQKIIL